MGGVFFRKVSANGRCLSVYGRCLLSKGVCQWELSQCLLEVSAYGKCLPMRGVSRVYESCLFAGGVFLPEVSSYRVSFHGKSLYIESVHGRRNDCGKFAEI